MNKFILSFCMISLVCYSSCKNKVEQKEESGKYSVTNPIMKDTSFTKEYVAQIQSVQNVELRAKVKGYLESINVDEGQYVKAGQVLFTIRPNEFQANLLKAKANVKAAELKLQNSKSLSDKQIISKSEFETAQAELDEAKAEESLAELDLSYTTIKAPFDGIIDRIKSKVGSLIDEGGLLTTISNNKDVYAYFNVSELEYLDFKSNSGNGDKKEVSLLLANNEPHKYKGVIETIEGEFDNNTGSIPFRAKFPNPELLLKHGETGKVQMTVNLKNSIIIPQKATYELQDKKYVYVVDKNNVVHSQNIIIKQSLPNIYVVESGITVNDKILLEGIQSVKDDDKIQSTFVSPAESISQINIQ
mgnify:CR=1 FL=1